MTDDALARLESMSAEELDALLDRAMQMTTEVQAFYRRRHPVRFNAWRVRQLAFAAAHDGEVMVPKKGYD